MSIWQWWLIYLFGAIIVGFTSNFFLELIMFIIFWGLVGLTINKSKNAADVAKTGIVLFAIAFVSLIIAVSIGNLYIFWVMFICIAGLFLYWKKQKIVKDKVSKTPIRNKNRK